jgi:hypothetical protein
MKMIRNAILIFLSFFPFQAFSQYSYFKNARIVKSDSNIVSGYVEKISESDLSFQVRFKKSLEDAKGQTIPVMDIDHIVFMDDSSVFCKVKYVHTKDSVTTIEYRLAKKLLNGYAELYKLQLPNSEVHIVYELNNTFVYIVKIDTNFYVLDQTEILDTAKWEGFQHSEGHVGYMHKLKKSYITVLRRLLKDDKVLNRRLKKLKLKDNQIIPLIDDFNKTHPEIPRKVLFIKEKAVVRHSVSLASVAKTNREDLFNSGFEIGYLAKIYNPNISEKISSYIGISFVNLYYNTFNDNGMHSIKGIKIPITLTYHFNNNKISPYAGLGFSFYVLNDYSMPLFLHAALGVTFYKKFNVAFAIEKNAIAWLSGNILFLNFSFDFYK